jgi:hypothetical protein
MTRKQRAWARTEARTLGKIAPGEAACGLRRKEDPYCSRRRSSAAGLELGCSSDLVRQMLVAGWGLGCSSLQGRQREAAGLELGCRFLLERRMMAVEAARCRCRNRSRCCSLVVSEGFSTARSHSVSSRLAREIHWSIDGPDSWDGWSRSWSRSTDAQAEGEIGGDRWGMFQQHQQQHLQSRYSVQARRRDGVRSRPFHSGPGHILGLPSSPVLEKACRDIPERSG